MCAAASSAPLAKSLLAKSLLAKSPGRKGLFKLRTYAATVVFPVSLAHCTLMLHTTESHVYSHTSETPLFQYSNHVSGCSSLCANGNGNP